MTVPTLQQLLLRHVSTRHIIQRNMTHLLDFHHRLIDDMIHHPIETIPQWFLCYLFDQGETSYFWFHRFIHSQAPRIPLNMVMFACWQERYEDRFSMNVFAMRHTKDKVLIFVYGNEYYEKGGIHYAKHPPDNVFDQKLSCCWTKEDWGFLSTMRLDCIFTIGCPYVNRKIKTRRR